MLALEQERLKLLSDAPAKDSFFYVDELHYETPMLIQKNMDEERTRAALVEARDLLTSLDTWEQVEMETKMRELGTQLQLKPGPFFGSVRVAVSGSNATPPLFQMMEVLGREVSMKRIEQAIERLS